MKKVNRQTFELTPSDFTSLGFEIERIMEAIKDHDYGIYTTSDDMGLEHRLALKVIEGMDEWQRQHNKGVRLRGIVNMRIEIYELHELQERIDEVMKRDIFAPDV